MGLDILARPPNRPHFLARDEGHLVSIMGRPRLARVAVAEFQVRVLRPHRDGAEQQEDEGARRDRHHQEGSPR